MMQQADHFSQRMRCPLAHLLFMSRVSAEGTKTEWRRKVKIHSLVVSATV